MEVLSRDHDPQAPAEMEFLAGLAMQGQLAKRENLLIAGTAAQLPE